ncbi:ATP-binding cassette domain-containing protein [Marispirochaeta aestuarii]|uniref:ATP-binding cassette domain-containing protein n=1 Tax=Marispirochaeta aestuarii TaxID=1963862 RepID=UPI0029C784BB|nr:ATP-binding cassette domain-containing protein [Marispirochaeta aestuarii]
MLDSGGSIRARNVHKYFNHGEVKALDGAGIILRRGEIHGLLGENGSGKTTLVRCIAGIVQPDSGEILMDGIPAARHNRSKRSGKIAYIPQHPRLVPSLTVQEFLHLGMNPARQGRDEAAGKIRRISERLRIDLPLSTRGDRVPANLVTATMIVEALLKAPDFLILDEPSTSFTPLETENLFSLLQELAAEGMGILIVSHKIREVRQLAHRLTLLRKGKSIAETEARDLSLEEISRILMGTGDRAAELTPSSPGGICLEIRNLSKRSRESFIRNISFSLRRGEILALSGIRENGLDCLEKILSASVQPDAGEILMAGGTPYPREPERIKMAGIAMVPSDRLESGAALGLPVMENAAVLVRNELSRYGILGEKKKESYTRELLSEYGISAHPRSLTSALSGGMLQRLILGREILSASGLVILCEPAWGLDVKGRLEVYHRILSLRDRGAGILLLASDIDEVLEIADRLLVLYNGEITASFQRDQFDHGRIGEAMLGICGTGDGK